MIEKIKAKKIMIMSDKPKYNTSININFLINQKNQTFFNYKSDHYFFFFKQKFKKKSGLI